MRKLLCWILGHRFTWCKPIDWADHLETSDGQRIDITSHAPRDPYELCTRCGRRRDAAG